LSANAIDAIERQLGTALPAALRTFYAEVGDGVAGPGYGLEPAAELGEYRAAEDYPGIEMFRRIAAAEGMPADERGYFEMSHEALAGLLSIIHEGCGHEICLIATGPNTGNVVYVSADGHVVETQKTLIDIYAKWLDGEIERFETVRALMQDNKSFEQIKDEMIARFHDYRAGDRIASIADVSKPAILFGEENSRIYHGATQNPWYEEVLEGWQRKKT